MAQRLVAFTFYLSQVVVGAADHSAAKKGRLAMTVAEKLKFCRLKPSHVWRSMTTCLTLNQSYGSCWTDFLAKALTKQNLWVQTRSPDSCVYSTVLTL